MNTLDLLAIEAFIFSPHLETTAEILLTNAQQNKKIAFTFLEIINPDDHYPYKSMNPFAPSRARKVRKCSAILKQNGVSVISPPTLSATELDKVKDEVSRLLSTVNSITDLINLTYENSALGYGIASSFISMLGESEPNIDENRSIISVYIYNSIVAFKQTKLLIKSFAPKKILTFNGRFASSKAISEAARSEGVEVLYHERGADPSRYYLAPHLPHNFSVRRREMQNDWSTANTQRDQIGESFFKRRRGGDGISWTSYTADQIKNFVPPKENLTRVVYFSSSDDEYVALGDFIKQPIFAKQRDAIKWLIDEFSTLSNVELIIRIHPHMKLKGPNDQAWWSSLKSHNLQVITQDSLMDSYGLLDTADLVISYGSTMGVEATYWGKPAICLGDSGYAGLNCVYEPTSLQELKALIHQKTWDPKPKENCLPFGYYMLTYGEKYKYFEPQGLFAGRLFGHSLKAEGILQRAILFARGTLKNILYPKKV